ncbi:MAG: hypothetical protein QMC38_07655, partial [Sinobacterium sp.]
RDSFFLSEQVAINKLNEEIKILENTPKLLVLSQQLAILKTEHSQQLSALREELVENRKIRKKQRQTLQSIGGKNQDKAITDKGLQILAQQSVHDKWRLKELTEHSQQLIGLLQVKVNEFTDQIAQYKLQRKTLSANLQTRIFCQYQFLNKKLEPKSLKDIFADTALTTPPAGAGECAAPKLLQYAFKQQLTPLAMAEFWWGASPKSEVKKHKQYYPACTGKCQPILKHMLAGMQLDQNLLIRNYGEDKKLDIIYQDEDILIVN